MENTRSVQFLFAALLALALCLPAAAQQADPAPASLPNEAGVAAGRLSAGQKHKLSGIILRQAGETLLVRDYKGTEYNVALNSATKIRERKNNPFRGAKKYETANLSRGLAVEIEGRGNTDGALVAESIKFSEAEFRVANSVVSLVTPVEGRVTKTEGRVTDTENRVTLAEQNALRLSGQLEELAAVANTANGGARAAQETADKALTAANTANEQIVATNGRISSLDEYDTARSITINFKSGSALLSDEAKAALDEIAEQTKGEKGYVIQVAGFASADGNETLNRRLSQRRADAVMSYLIENHDIAQRRLVAPLGFGTTRPVADNATRDGRRENRRVEVSILVSKGLASTASTATASNLTPQP